MNIYIFYHLVYVAKEVKIIATHSHTWMKCKKKNETGAYTQVQKKWIIYNQHLHGIEWKEKNKKKI